MSSAFHIISAHLKKNGTRTNKSALANSQLTPRSNFDSEDDVDSYDNEEVLKLEIRQLTRENKFLKKKILELTAQINGDDHPKKKFGLGKGMPKEELDPTHATAEYFFKEVNNMMSCLTDLFRVNFTSEEIKQFQTKFPTSDQDKEVTPQRKYYVYTKLILSRKLQKIALESQEKRYLSLLEVFTNYYKIKQDCDKYLRKTIDELSTKVLELNSLIFKHASTKKRSSLRGSCVKSQYIFDEPPLSSSSINQSWNVKLTPPEESLQPENIIRKKLQLQ